MPVNPLLTASISSGTPLYRITSPAFNTADTSHHVKVVNGRGALRSALGARYNYPMVPTVYLTEEVETCFAERMFYFHRDVLRALDLSHLLGVIPAFGQPFVLWEIIFRRDMTDIIDLSKPAATSSFNIFPSLTVNPSQDYQHLKQKRSEIQYEGYRGLRVRSSRVLSRGNLVVLFEDQSSYVQRITPYPVEFRLIDSAGNPFTSHASDILDFTAGEVRFVGHTPRRYRHYRAWQRIGFNH